MTTTPEGRTEEGMMEQDNGRREEAAWGEEERDAPSHHASFQEGSMPGDSSDPGTPPEANDAGTQGGEVGDLMGELEEVRDRHIRLVAEFENYRKRTREELSRASGRAQAALVGSLVEALDDFERVHAVDPDHATVASVLEGVEMVERKLNRILAEAGMELLDPEGDTFDPETMEAVVRVPTTEGALDDGVAQVLQRGVVFQGHLVRPARVAVYKVEG